MISILITVFFILAFVLIIAIAHDKKVKIGRSLIVFILALAVVYGLYRAFSRYEQWIKEERRSLALTTDGPICVAVVWPASERQNFINGINLGVKKINDAGGVTFTNDVSGGAFKRPLKVFRFEERNRNDGNRLARKIARDPRFTTVIGHAWSDSAIPASVTYEDYGVLFISPVATNPELTRHGFDHLISLVPTDRRFGERIAVAMTEAGVTNVMILYDIGYYGTGLMNCFEEFAGKVGLRIVGKQSFNHSRRDFRPMIAEIRQQAFDAIMLADSGPDAARMIRQIRELSVNKPIYGGEGLDVSELTSVIGRMVARSSIMTIYSIGAISTNGTPTGIEFLEQYRALYKQDPDYMAVQGYEAIILLARAYTRANSILPLDVTGVLKFMSDSWEGVLGRYTFRPNGEIIGKKIYVKEVRDGRLVMSDENGGKQP